MIDSVIFAFGYKQRSGKDTAVAEIIRQRGLLLPSSAAQQWEGSTEGMVHGVGTQPEGRYDIRKYSFADALRREVDAEYRKAGGVEKVFAPNYCFSRKGYVVTLPDWVKFDPNGEINEQYPFSKQRTFLQWWGGDYRRSEDAEYWVRQLAQQIELEKPQLALISDLRYLNEFHFCKEYGEVIKVERLGIPQGTHASETELDSVSDEEWSIILENSGTLEEFLEAAVTAFDELMLGFPYGYAKR